MSLKIITLEKERDQLKWNQDKQALENKINEYNDLLKSKEAEFSIREKREGQKYKDEIFSIEEEYKE